MSSEDTLDILTPKQVAEMFPFTARWVYNHALELGGVKIGGAWIFTREGLENAIQRRRQVAGQGNVPGAKIYQIERHQNRGTRLGKRKTPEAERERKELAERAGLAEFV